MKYKISALFLGLTFAGVSQAAIINVAYTLTTPVFGAAFTNGDTQTLGAGFVAAGSVNLDTNGTAVGQTLFTILYTPSSNTVTSSSRIDSTTITVTGGLPSAAQTISSTFLDTLAAGPTHTLTTSVLASPVIFTLTANNFKVTITPLNITQVGPIGTSGTGQNVQVSANFAITSTPEPSTWMLLGSSLIGLGFLARRRTTVRLN